MPVLVSCLASLEQGAYSLYRGVLQKHIGDLFWLRQTGFFALSLESFCKEDFRRTYRNIQILCPCVSMYVPWPLANEGGRQLFCSCCHWRSLRARFAQPCSGFAADAEKSWREHWFCAADASNTHCDTDPNSRYHEEIHCYVSPTHDCSVAVWSYLQ